jgi:hypothetical protein
MWPTSYPFSERTAGEYKNAASRELLADVSKTILR